jgi:methionyl-tRNA formyltransferase
LRTVYLGTSEFATTVLRALAASPHRPTLVVTRPDAPHGRGRRLRPPPVATAALALGIPCIQPEDVNAAPARERIAVERPGNVCICAYGAIIGDSLLAAHRMLNVHPSLLPRWRGAAPIERAIMAGDARTGVSIMVPVAELDAGPVCVAREEPIAEHDTYGTLSGRLATLAGGLLIEALDREPQCRDQDPSTVTYADKITAADRLLDPTRPAAELARVVRALTPHIGARLELGDHHRCARQDAGLKVRRAHVVNGGPRPGVLSLSGARPLLGCSEGALELLEVQPPGGTWMTGEDYLRGHRRG